MCIFLGEPGALAPWGLTVSGERALSTGLNESPGCFSLPTVRPYALVEAGDPKAIDVYLSEQDAQRALEDCLRNEPNWRGVLRVEEIEFAGMLESAN